tara:strand:+ start:1007 stop:1306 length:300 start_codon:yes stop_codon:yes gene_type:complete
MTIEYFHEEPYVGMGATVGAGSDCYPATVIDVGSKSITIQWDTYRREGDEWVYERNPNGKKEVYTLRKNGRYKLKGWPLKSRGGYVGLGHRRYYNDPSF